MGIETALLTLISQYGLPVVVLVVVGWFLLKRLEKYLDAQQKKDDDNRKYMVDRIEKSELRQEALTKIGQELSETNRVLVERFTIELGDIKEEVSDIGNKLDIVNVKLDNKK